MKLYTALSQQTHSNSRIIRSSRSRTVDTQQSGPNAKSSSPSRQINSELIKQAGSNWRPVDVEICIWWYFSIVFPLFSFVFAGWRAAKEWHMGAGSLYLHMEIYAPTCVWLSWGQPTKYFTKFNWNIWIMNNICVCRFLPPFVFASCLGSFEILKFVWKYKLLPLVVTNLSLERRSYFALYNYTDFHFLL